MPERVQPRPRLSHLGILSEELSRHPARSKMDEQTQSQVKQISIIIRFSGFGAHGHALCVDVPGADRVHADALRAKLAR